MRALGLLGRRRVKLHHIRCGTGPADAGGSMGGERPREKGLTAEARSALVCWRKGKQACGWRGREGVGEVMLRGKGGGQSHKAVPLREMGWSDLCPSTCWVRNRPRGLSRVPRGAMKTSTVLGVVKMVRPNDALSACMVPASHSRPLVLVLLRDALKAPSPWQDMLT